MNKIKIIMASIGGVALVASLALGYFIFSLSSERDEKLSDLDTAKSRLNSLCTAAVPVNKTTVAMLSSNATLYASWKDDIAGKIVAGDLETDKEMTAPAFKDMITKTRAELMTLPGNVNGKIAKEGFGFGFDEYINGDKMPEDAQLDKMQRQWADIVRFVKIFAACNVGEVVSIAVAAEPKAAENAESKPNDKRNKKRMAQASRDKKPESAIKPAILTYNVVLSVRQDQLVKVVNGLATDERFIVVDSMNFAHPADTVLSMIGGDDKDKPKAQAPRRRRRGAGAVQEEPKAEEEKERKGLVVSPESEKPFVLTLTLSTYDFGSKSVKENSK